MVFGCGLPYIYVLICRATIVGTPDVYVIICCVYVAGLIQAGCFLPQGGV